MVKQVGRRGVGEFFAGFGVDKMQAPTSEEFKYNSSFCESWVYLETPYSTEVEAIREGYVKALGMWSTNRPRAEG
jgi:hypothetical protein